MQTVPLMDDCIPGPHNRPILVIMEPPPSPLLAPLTPQTPALQQDRATEEPTPPKPTEPVEDRSLDSGTPIQQVSPLLGTTPRENLQLRNKNSPEDISDVLGTHIFQGYVETPLQMLDGIIVNQPKRFLPLAKEAKRLAEEIRIKKLNAQWASILHEQILNQSFTDQLNSIQILEQLAPLELAKKHLPADIINILEHLGKADNIPFNQLYYIAENCVDQYYMKVIETFVPFIKRQFADCQLLLVNTAQCLKFLEDYADRQSQIWKIFHKHHTIPKDLQDFHFHFDDFKNSLEKDFKFLKEATSQNIQNFQTSHNLQQMYSSSLCSHVNNIYNKLSELQRQIQNHQMHMNPGDTVQIEAPDFDPDIDRVSLSSADKNPNDLTTQGTSSPTPAITEPEGDSLTPVTTIQQFTSQEMDWLDAIPVQIPWVSSSTFQPEEQEITRSQARHHSKSFKIPDLKDNSEEEQFANLESYLAHNNTYKASQHVCQEYRSRLHDLDNDQYYAETYRAYYLQDILAAQDYQPANQSAEPHRTTEELKRLFGRGRGQARREELYGHQPFGPRTRSLQSCIQCKIKKNQ